MAANPVLAKRDRVVKTNRIPGVFVILDVLMTCFTVTSADKNFLSPQRWRTRLIPACRGPLRVAAFSVVTEAGQRGKPPRLAFAGADFGRTCHTAFCSENFFGLNASVSMGDLFIAVIFPGFLLAAFYLVYVLVRSRLNPDLGPPLTLAVHAYATNRSHD